MKSVVDLMSSLRAKNVSLWVENGQLSYDAPLGSLTDDDLARIGAHKPFIIELLSTVEKDRVVQSIEPADRTQPLPLSLAQQRLWFIDQLEGAEVAYNIQGAVNLRGELDQSTLQAALDTIVFRHEVLRTVFQSIDGNAVQVIANEASFALQFTEVSAPSAHERETILQQLATQEAQTRFDLSKGPLIRGLLVRTAPEDHVLLVTMHHIVSDGWSIGLLFHELATLYEAYHEGGTDPLPPLVIQYADYAQWQRRQVAATQGQLDYWKQQLNGAPGLLELPTDRSRPPKQSYAGVSIPLALTTELSAGVKALAKQHDVTLFMTLYTAWAILLARLSGQDDVVIGVPVANRQRVELEGLIGFFVNTLPLRAQLTDDVSVSELLSRVKDMTLDAYKHQEVPFSEVIEAVRPARSLSHSPIFQVMFMLQNNVPTEVQSASGLSFRETGEYIAGGINNARFDLSLSLEEAGDQFVGALNYSTDLFDRATVERWIEYFKAVVAGMIQDASSKVNALSLLGSRERRQVLQEFNATSVEYPANKLVHQLFEEQVRKTPQTLAVIYEDEQLTYAELNRKANQLARYLRRQGVGPDQPVAICVERSLEMVVGLLGIMKAGGAYVPLDPSYPSERLEYMLNDAAPRLILTQEHIKSTLPATAAQVIALDTQWNEIAEFEDTDIDSQTLGLTPRNLAYVIYTSGSTGQPKGVMNEHRGVVNRLDWMQDRYRLNQDDRILQKTPFSFDVSVWEFFWPLLNGARLIVARPKGHQDPGYLRDLIQQRGVTTLHFVPSMLDVFLDQHASGQCKSIRRVVCSGEELSPALQDRCLRELPQAELNNLYGPTEAAIDVTYWDCRLDGNESRVPIGRPISNTQIYILDSMKQPVPIGVAGEIYIGGTGVARGYLNRPELTAERFIADPFSDDAQARLYKTGDLGRWRADGNIEYLGRNDDQVKIRGFRIELGEIETALRRHPQVKEAVVLHAGTPSGKGLVAYLTYRGEAPNIEALRSQLGDVLPEYMIPYAFVMLESLPLTPNGKLDRKQLPPVDITAQLRDQYVAPGNFLEEKLCEIWAEVLNLHRVGVADDFFALGGDSILSIRILEKARVAGLTFALEDMFRYPTIARLAQSIQEGQTVAPDGRRTLPFELLSLMERAQFESDSNVEDAYPLTALQAGMHFHSELNRDSAVYHDIFSVCVDRAFQREPFVRAARALVQRHEILRSGFSTSVDSRLLQVVHKTVNFDVQVDDISHLAPAEQDGFVEEWIEQERWRRFVWSQAPLLRIFVHVRSANQFQYSLSFHHAILDGWSLACLQTELFEHYFSLIAGAEKPMAAPKSLYRDYVALEQQTLESETSREYWRQALENAHRLSLPAAAEVHARHKGKEVATFERSFSQELYRQLDSQARELKVSLKVLLVAAHVKVMALISGQQDVLTGLVSNCRLEEKDADKTLGLFLNSLPLRAKLGDGTWKELVMQIQGLEQSMFPHRRYPLQAIQQLIGSESVINTLFNFVHFHVYQRLFDAGMVKVPKTRVFEQTNFDLMVVFSKPLTGDGISLSLAYDPAVLAPELVERMWVYYENALRAIGTQIDAPHNQTPLLTKTEQEQLTAWNATEVQYPNTLIHELFEAQAAKTPQATALTVNGREVSYAELNQKANQLARYLRDRGVGSDRLVAICVERNLQMVIGMLATLKSGGAYVPIDPGYPAERLAYLLDDAAPTVILTQAKLATGLPATQATVISLDTQWHEVEAYEDTNLVSGSFDLTPRNLAYLIYTSGSTGKPKGVMIEHGNVSNFIQWGRSEFSAEELRRTIFSTSINFDLSVFELFVPLTLGGVVHLVESAVELDEAASGATLINTVPSALNALLESERIPESIRVVNLAGEALQRDLVERIFSRIQADYVANLYGPSETTTYSTFARFHRSGSPDPHIGRPVANTQIYILDSMKQPVPIGVAGEIYIGGTGVARGYLNRPELTAERFIADPFSDDPQARLYKTGDLGRWRADGNIEYLGRNDDQVKIRGFRIELGEIETALRRHPQVKEAVVLARDTDKIGPHLVAYILASDAREFDQPEEEFQIHGWQTVFEDKYVPDTTAVAPEDNFSVWVSSYDGQPLGLDEMRTWANLAVSRIAQLPADDLLEIGCGVGLMLFRLLPLCRTYVGTDFSQNALDTIATGLPDEARTKVELIQADAADFTLLAGRQFDTTVLNSVVQYFPGVEYLSEVLKSAIDQTRAGGAIFIGDVRNYQLLESFATSVVMHKAEPGEALDVVRQRIRNQINTESELVISPECFVGLTGRLPRVSHIEVLPKFTEEYDNELFNYRYDVILHIERDQTTTELRQLDWKQDHLSLSEIENYLETERPTYLRISSIPNSRLHKTLQLQNAILGEDDEFKAVGDVLYGLTDWNTEADCPQPRELIELARKLSYTAEPSWLNGGVPGDYSLLLSREGAPRYLTPASELKESRVDFRRHANDPLWNRKVAQLTTRLKAHVQECLPEHMHPTFYGLLDALPLTPNGKVDRKALAADDVIAHSLQRSNPPQGDIDENAPQGEIEQALAAIWQDLLGVERVGRHDDFFDLGGHSLLAVQMTYRIYVSLGWEAEVWTLFEFPTVYQLAKEFKSGGAVTRAAIERVDRSQPLPLSAAQRRLWLLNQEHGDTGVYQVPHAVAFHGVLDREALQAALDTIMERHESLRTVYDTVDGEPVQVIKEGEKFVLEQVDLSAYDPEEREAAVRLQAEEEASVPFDLSTGPVLRGRLIRMSENEHVFMFTSHAIVYDGWSRGVFLRELGTLYAAYKDGKPNPLPPLEIQYVDYAQWQNAWLEKVLPDGLDYWTEQLAGAPELLELPTDRPRPAVPSMKGDGVRMDLNPKLSARLKAMAAQYDATLYMTLFTGWAIFLLKLSGQTDLVIGTLVANREVAEVEGLIGAFLNYLPMRVQITDDTTVRDLLEQVKEMAKGAYSHQWVPFSEIVNALQPMPNSSHSPLFQVSLMLENTPTNELRLPGIEFAPQDDHFVASEFDLELSMKENDGRIMTLLLYATDLFDRATIEQWLEYFKEILTDMVEGIDRKVNDLSVLRAGR